MVDGILLLRQQLVRSRHERTLEVVKFRGARVLYGSHTFRIGDDGIALFPQLEAVPAPDLGRDPPTKIGAVVPGLDAMLGGGYPAGSVTAISGPEGAGKTLMGLQFFRAPAQRNQRCFSAWMSRESRRAVGAAFGIDIEGLRKAGTCTLPGSPTLANRWTKSAIACWPPSGIRVRAGYSSTDLLPWWRCRPTKSEALHSLRPCSGNCAGLALPVCSRFESGGGPLCRRAGKSPPLPTTASHSPCKRDEEQDRPFDLNLQGAGQLHDLTTRELDLTASGLRVGAWLRRAGVS